MSFLTKMENKLPIKKMSIYFDITITKSQYYDQNKYYHVLSMIKNSISGDFLYYNFGYINSYYFSLFSNLILNEPTTNKIKFIRLLSIDKEYLFNLYFINSEKFKDYIRNWHHVNNPIYRESIKVNKSVYKNLEIEVNNENL